MDSKNLKIAYWNASGITKKIHELQTFILQHKIDIILLSETHLSPAKKLKITIFHTYRNDLPPRRGSPAHGGTAILIHRRITHQKENINTTLQSTSVRIQMENKETIITAV